MAQVGANFARPRNRGLAVLIVTASPIFRYRAARVAKNYTVLLALKAIL